jgi:hypothetical protein
MRYRVILVLSLILSISYEPAGSTDIGVYDSYDPSGRFIDVHESGLVGLYVVVEYATGLTHVEFSAPPPECMGSVTLVTTNYYFPYVGDIETGVSLSLGDCLTGTITLASMWFVGASVDSCCPYDILPHISAVTGEIEGLDCTGNTVIIESSIHTLRPVGMMGCGAPTVPSNPIPPDGAVNQPLTVMLDWESEPTAGTNMGVFFANVYFGTDPDPSVELWNLNPPQQVGPLTPHTTYYWKVKSIVTDYGWTMGPLWTFSTGAGVPVKQTTWGAIKSLYRD